MSKRHTPRAAAPRPAAPVAQDLHKNTALPPTGGPDWDAVARVLAQHPQLWDVLDGVRRRALTRAEAPASNVPASATLTPHNPVAGHGGPSSLAEQPLAVPNARVLRAYAERDPWVRAAIQWLVRQVASADVAVVPLDPRLSYDRSVKATIERLLREPNELRQNWAELIGSVTEDICVLDRGVILKSMTAKRVPMGLYAQDGATIKIYPAWQGDPNQPRYLYDPPYGTPGQRVALLNDECIMFVNNASTYRWSLSPVQVLVDTIQRDLDASESAAHVVSQKPPPHIVHFAGANDAAIRRLKATYDTDVAGKREIMFTGGEVDPKVLPLVFSLKDAQWMDWLTYLARQITACFGVSPQQIGLTMDINKATSVTQQANSESAGLIPLFLLLERYLNRELLEDFAPRDKLGRPNVAKLNLALIFPKVTEEARMLHAQVTVEMGAAALVGLPTMTLNQVLALRGEEGVAGGNTFWVATKEGPMPWLSYGADATDGDYQPGLATAGNLGAQAPASGPAASGADDDGAPNLNDTPDAPQGVPAAPAPAAAASSPAAAPASAPAAGGDAAKAWHDPRQPGQLWAPHLIRRRHETPPPPHDHARNVLEAAVRRIMTRAGDAHDDDTPS